MNKILKEKINRHMIDIVALCLLPITNKDTKFFGELINKTWHISYDLNGNTCLDISEKFYVSGLKNTKIKKINMLNYYYWSIRKIKTDI